MTGPGRAPVIVGIDGPGSALEAVDWATAEAATRGLPLRIVHAFHPALPADPYGMVPPTDCLAVARTGAETLLREAVARSRAVASDVEVPAHLLPGAPNPALLDEATRAALLVLGSRGLSGMRGLLSRSVSVQVAAHACCPVVIIRQSHGAGDPGRAPARVVVGVEPAPGTGTSGAGTSGAGVIGFAFEAARQRGIPLAAVHAWRPPEAEALASGALARALEPWRHRFPDVTVLPAPVRDDPAHALVTASRGAALVVVGSRGRGHLRGSMFGSVSQAVLHHGYSPVAIVRDLTGPPDTDAAGTGERHRRRHP